MLKVSLYTNNELCYNMLFDMFDRVSLLRVKGCILMNGPPVKPLWLNIFLIANESSGVNNTFFVVNIYSSVSVRVMHV